MASLVDTQVLEDPDVSENRDKDQLLMRRVAARDREAQKVLAGRLVGRVRRLCRTLMDDLSEADDASQQALVEILQSAGNFREPGNLEAWADTITVRTALRMSRRLRSNRSWIEQVALPERLAHFASDMRRKDITSGQLEAYLDRIALLKRQAFVLHHALGYTVDEIAVLSDSPTGTVKDRLVSARKELRKMIAREMASASKGSA